jgi:myo-inositol-1(or 4)-monophosphatase
LTDWLATCRAAVEDVRTVLAELPARSDREPVVGAGVGGDDTTAIDAAVERAVVARLDTAGDHFTLVSEELGVRRLEIGSDSDSQLISESDSDSQSADKTWIVLDPIDGSINAKRGLPFFSLSVAVADGGTMGHVGFGYVYDFTTGDEWTAQRGQGAKLNGEPLSGEPPKDRIEILALEATRTDLVARHAPPLVGLVHRLRVFGSLALSLCYLADGRVDAVCSLKPARSVDIAAAQLLVRERGYAIELPDDPPFGAAPLDLAGRSRVVAAGTIDLCAEVAAALGA